MRIALTLDDDVAAALQALARERQLSFKDAVNSTLRRGLSAPPSTSRYRLPTRDLGLRPGVDLAKALRLADELEDGHGQLEPEQRG